MVVNFVRKNENRIERRNMVSFREFDTRIEMYERELNKIEMTLKLLEENKTRKYTILELKTRKEKILEKMNELYSSYIIDHFNETNMHSIEGNRLEFTPILSSEKREKQKCKNFALNVSRNKKRVNNPMITLDPKDYK